MITADLIVSSDQVICFTIATGFVFTLVRVNMNRVRAGARLQNWPLNDATITVVHGTDGHVLFECRILLVGWNLSAFSILYRVADVLSGFVTFAFNKYESFALAVRGTRRVA